MKTLSVLRKIIKIFAFILIAAPGILLGSISVTNNAGIWTNTAGGLNLTGAGTSLIKWGGSSNQFRSGFGYAAQPVIFPVSLGQEFNLGTYTQYNRVIPVGGGLTAAQFNGAVSLNFDGVQINNLTFTYSFLHDETPNIAGQCPPGQSVCADLNTITNNGSIDIPFNANGNNYILTVLGFKKNGALTSQFSTAENHNTILSLDAIITAQVYAPEPGTYLLLGSTVGLILFVSFLKKKRGVRSYR